LIVRSQNKQQLLSLWKRKLEDERSNNGCRTVSADITALKAKRFSLNEMQELRTYTGVVDLSCVTEKSYEDLRNHLLKELRNEGVMHKEDNLVLNCQKKGVIFEIEIMKLNCFRYVRIKHLAGDKRAYNTIISKLLRNIIL